MQTKKRYSLKSVFWVLLTVYGFFLLVGYFVTFLQEVQGKNTMTEFFSSKTLLKQFSGIICQTFLYYFSLNYYNTLMTGKKDAIYYFPASLLLLFCEFFYFLGMYKLFPEKAVTDNKITTGILMFSFFASATVFTAASLLLAYLNNLRDEKKHRKILEAQKMQLEIDKSQANFKFLKSQINPHFLHNTLNFLYAKSLPYSAELSEGILTLSEIMRYALQEATGSDDKAPLKNEIAHVRNVIKINQLRFSNNLHVRFEVKGVVNEIEIIPLLLITVVENAFKHGDLQSVDHPIEINLTIGQKQLYFYCRNKKKSGPKEMSTGLGLDNIRNRLDFAYGSNYELLIKDESDFYTTALTIKEL
ncbi:MAG: histidine kinase [Ferruginibacter sp.]